jgi:hypothetical protein
MKKFNIIYILMFLLLIINVSANDFGDVCSNDSSKYYIYETFESGTSTYFNLKGAGTVQSSYAYNSSVYSLRCNFDGTNNCGYSNILLPLNSSILAYVMRPTGSIGSVSVTAFGTPNTNYLTLMAYAIASPCVHNNWNYGDGDGFGTYNIGASSGTSNWDRIYWYQKNTTNTVVNITNSSGSTILKVVGIPTGGTAYTFPTNLSLGSGATEGDSIWIDNIFVWNRTKYGDTCPQDEVIVAVIPSYNVSNNKNPLDINSSFVGIMNITTIISPLTNTTNPYNKTNGYTELYFNVNTSLNSCTIFYQTSCIKFSNNYYLYNMTKKNATVYESLFTDNDYYPTYYPYNYSFINDNIGVNDTIYRQKGIRFNVYNFSTSTQAQFLDIEFQANNLSYFPLNIYYCNSTYANNSPLLNPNCEIIDVFLPSNHIFHFHNISRHYFVPIQIYNVTRTKLSYFLFVSNTILQSNGYDFRYVLNSNYDNSSFNNFNQVFSQSTTNKIYDIHIHNYLEADFIRYYTKYYDGETYKNTSSVSIDFYNIINVPPSSSFVSVNETSYTLSNSTNTSILFIWSQSTDLNNDTFTYNLSIYNSLYNYNIGVFNQTTTTYEYKIMKGSFYIGDYYIKMQVCDSFGNCDISISDSTFNICSNNWIPDIRPCLGGAKELAYYDSNSCITDLDLPTIEGNYIKCEGEQMLIFSFENNTLLLIILCIAFICSIIFALSNKDIVTSVFYLISSFLLVMINIVLSEFVQSETWGNLRILLYIISLFFVFFCIYQIYKSLWGK